jgi:hypothetical protein
MPRWLAHAIVVVGWLLTPLWAWGASFLGAWVGARLAMGLSSPTAMLAVAGAIALGGGLGALWLWVRMMRRLPHRLSHRMAPRRSQEAKVAPAE